MPFFVPGLRERARKDRGKPGGRHPFFSSLQRKAAPLSAEPLRPCCDSCREKIYISIIKQLRSLDSVHTCVCLRPRLYLEWKSRTNSTRTDSLLFCVHFPHCFQGRPGVMGIEGQPGLAGYTVSFSFLWFNENHSPKYAWVHALQKHTYDTTYTNIHLPTHKYKNSGFFRPENVFLLDSWVKAGLTKQLSP